MYLLMLCDSLFCEINEIFDDKNTQFQKKNPKTKTKQNKKKKTEKKHPKTSKRHVWKYVCFFYKLVSKNLYKSVFFYSHQYSHLIL